MKPLNKVNVFIISVLLNAVFLTVIFLGTDYCYENIDCRLIRNVILDDKLFFTSFFPLILVFSLITFPLNTVVFENWKKFSIWAVPILIILSYLIIKREESVSGGFMNVEIGPIIIGLLYVIYFLVSLIIIGFTWKKTQRKR